MYIDILLAFALVVSFSLLWRRISEKIPELELIPDQDLSVMLEENTAKLQRFFLHLFHFRSFYRERHYHEKLRLFAAKMLVKLHIVVLRIDNGIVRLMRRLRDERVAPSEPAADRAEYFMRLQEPNIRESPQPNETMAAKRLQEVRPRKRSKLANSFASSCAEKPKAAFADGRQPQ